MSVQNKKVVVYTSIVDSYDFLRSVPKNLENLEHIDFICFSNCLSGGFVNGWEVRPLPVNDRNSTRICRRLKVNPHIFFPHHQASLWVDGNIGLTRKAVHEINKFSMSDYKVSGFSHPLRNCIYNEAKSCILEKKDDPELIKKQIEMIRQLGYPKENGLTETNVLFRKHQDPEVINAMNEWQIWIDGYSRRDQLSFDYVIWHSGIVKHVISGSARNNENECFVIGHHRSTGLMDLFALIESRKNISKICSLIVNACYFLKRKFIKN